MAKQIDGYIKLQVPAGSASPSPPVGPALGQHGLNLMDFCNAFNAKTNDMEKGLPVPVVITVYEDKSFDFIVKTTPASVLIKKAAGLKKGSGTPNSLKVGKVSRAQLEEIAKIKDPDLVVIDLMEELELPVYKIGSDLACHLPLLKKVSSLGKPIILSTGMCTMKEITDSVNTILDQGNDELMLLHCISDYPAKPEESNLNAILEMKKENFRISPK